MYPPARKKSRHGPLGKIEKLVLENFKSYEGVREIGPFQKFTCVIGPNGAGKSNVMDAISFCLGIRAKHLRGDKLKDLVHRKEKESSKENKRNASVTIHFRTGKGNLVLFSRSINATGQGAYRCGPEDAVRNVNYDGFLQELASHGILVKARNFLVFQGDVMELARQQGLELCTVLESLSGSDQLKDEYNRLSHELDATQEKARMHFQHLQELKGTVALLEKQRAEVDKYNELRLRIQQLEVESYLFTLLCGENDANRLRDDHAKFEGEVRQFERESKVRRKQADEREREARDLKAKRDSANNRLYIVGSNLQQLEPEINNGKKKLHHYRTKLQQTERFIREEEQKHKIIEAQLQQIRSDKRAAEEALAKKNAEVGEELLLNLTPKQRTEYNEAVEKTDMLNVRTREQLRETEEELTTLNRELEAGKVDLKGLNAKRSKIEIKLEEFDRKKLDLEQAVVIDTEEIDTKSRDLKALQSKLAEFQRFNSNLNVEAQALMKKLDGAHLRREKLQNVEEKQRIADELRSAFPVGVIGRVSELILPTQRRFDLAIQMCMGKLPDAFIVTDAKTGFACTRYMKQKRIKSENFLLMDRISIPQPGPIQKLTVGSTARHLAMMCVQPNEKFLERHPRWQASGPDYIDKAIKHLLNNSVIVNDIEEAKACAYHDARRHGLHPRVVTTDGEVISSNGNMSVTHVSQQSRVEFGGAEEIVEIRRQESKLEQIRQDRADLQDRHRKDKETERDIQEQMRTIEGRKASHEEQLKRIESEKTVEEKLVEAWRVRSEEITGQVKRNMATIESLERKRERLDSELLKVGKKYFARLSQELGVEDVREIMRKEETVRRKKQKERQELEDFIFTTTSEEKDLLRRLEIQTKMTSLKQSVQQYTQDAAKEEERLKHWETKQKDLKKQHESEIAQVRALNLQSEKLEEATKEAKQEMGAFVTQSLEARRKWKKTGEQLKIVLIATCSIFRECQEKQIEIPMAPRTNDVKMEMILDRAKDLEQISTVELNNACKDILVDFSPLPDDKKEVAKQTTVFDSKHVQLEYQNAMKALQLEREALNPNMKSLEQCTVETEKMQEVKAKAEEAAELSKKLEAEFDKVKTDRTSTFMECFRHVESKVNPFYKELTTYDALEGGSAYLDLDDPEEPYKGGITFTACPPGKRFFPMSQLSGGEKSMASMALLFAMHSYRPPPFMILDEVDAPFDRKNTNSLVSYLKKLHFQCIVISLKDTFFMHSDGIIGICKDLKAETSSSVTFHLNRMMSMIGPPKAPGQPASAPSRTAAVASPSLESVAAQSPRLASAQATPTPVAAGSETATPAGDQTRKRPAPDVTAIEDVVSPEPPSQVVDID